MENIVYIRHNDTYELGIIKNKTDNLYNVQLIKSSETINVPEVFTANRKPLIECYYPYTPVKAQSLIKKDVTVDDKLEYIRKKWNEIASIQGFPKVHSFTGNRRSSWKNIIRNHPDKSFWVEFFDVLVSNESKWLADATVGDKNLKWFNIDFFCKSNDDRVSMFVEGKYKQHTNSKVPANTYNNNDDIQEGDFVYEE